MRTLRSVLGFTCALAAATVALVDCGASADCDSVCDNVVALCNTELFVDDQTARNQCLEDCAQRVQLIPESCGAERDAMLICVGEAESVDCGDPQRSAACSDLNGQLNACLVGGGGGDGGGGGAVGPACTQDDECATGICNGKLEACAAPGAIGAPCYQDDECANDLCNSSLEVCSEPGELGDPCYQDDECANDLCNSSLEVCSEPGQLGDPCYQDDECASDLCNSSSEQCAEPGAAGTPCFQDDECVSNNCDNRSCA